VPDEPKNDASEDERDPQSMQHGADDADGDSTDAASPAAILKRVSALDEDDEGERIAREEEAKLEARRARDRQPKKKSGLQAAASKRLAKIGTKAPTKRAMATAADADPLLNRATDFGDWARKNQQLVAGAVAAVVVVVAGGLGYVAYERKRETDASVQLAKAVAQERGRIGDPDKEDDPDRPHDPSPIFKTNDDRREAALAAFRGVESKYHGTGAAILARLSEGSLLLDKEDADGALAAYTDVSTSPLAKADGEVRGRALEGMGFAYELKADAATGDAAKPLLDDAGKEYRTLENTDVEGFKELGIYHQARILQKQGDTAQAIDLLKKLHERLHKEGSDQHDFIYLEQVADDALRNLSPTALPPKPSPSALGRPAGAGGKHQIDAAQLQKMYEQLQKSGKVGTGAPMPGTAPK
jgi:hypothetical protein